MILMQLSSYLTVPVITLTLSKYGGGVGWEGWCTVINTLLSEIFHLIRMFPAKLLIYLSLGVAWWEGWMWEESGDEKLYCNRK